MNQAIDYLAEARRWSERAEENYAKACEYHDAICIRTMMMLGRSAEQYAERATALALQATPACAGVNSPGEDAGMLSKSGLHPYRAALFFILREQHDNHRVSRLRRAAMRSGDIENISTWQTVRLLAHSFGKSGHEVARDLVDEYRALENGRAAP